MSSVTVGQCLVAGAASGMQVINSSPQITSQKKKILKILAPIVPTHQNNVKTLFFFSLESSIGLKLDVISVTNPLSYDFSVF